MQESKLEIAKNMLKKNFHMSFIEQMTGVSAKYIGDLSQDL
ncbi:MAG: hypothetical protein ACYC2U_08530 [Candidatus Amoebophilus sp.]